MTSTLPFLLPFLLPLVSSGSPPAPSPVVFTEPQLSAARAAALERHNLYRCMHGAPPLKYDPDIIKQAQTYAQEMAASRDYKHSHTDLGENLDYIMSGHSSKFPPADPKATMVWAVDHWYAEIKDYQGFDKSTGQTGHFTQVIWKESTLVGAGVACRNIFENKFAGLHCYIVARYKKPGNVYTAPEYQKNVEPKPSKSKEACGGKSGGAGGNGRSTGSNGSNGTEEVTEKGAKGEGHRIKGLESLVGIVCVLIGISAVQMLN